MAFPLLLAVFVVATCGLTYELISGTLASYLLGDSVTQFSTVIGTYLFAMGIGSYLSRYVTTNCQRVFVQVELAIGLLGGSSAALLFFSFEHVASFRVILYGIVFLIGSMVGLEVPLMMRILKDRLEFKDLVSQIFTFDYVGALAASLLFPLVLAPKLGLVRSCFLFGIFNILVALWTLKMFRAEIGRLRYWLVSAFVILGILVSGFLGSDFLQSMAEASVYQHPVLYSKSSHYQRIAITHQDDEYRLYLNGHLQFSSRDEYRYHEALVHLGLQSVQSPERVLILGGGDGLALREVLRYKDVKGVDLVDLDGEVTQLFKSNPALARLNGNAFEDPRVKVTNTDAFIWVKQATRQDLPENSRYNFIVVDFPDPTNFSVGKLFSTAFYKSLIHLLKEDGLIVVQSTSPLFARKSYWCVDETLQASGFHTLPFHLYVPSFGEWGFFLAGRKPVRINPHPSLPLRFLNDKTIDQLLVFPPDMAKVPTQVNRLNNQILVQYYEKEWARYGF
jgi:spermidine synthase